MSSTETVQPVGDLPTPGTWYIDPAHSSVGFVVRHLMTKVRGHFQVFGGTIEIAERLTGTVVTADIDVASISTNQQMRDDHLRSPDFFDVPNHPTMTFRSTGVRESADGYLLDGLLSIRGVERPVALDVEHLGVLTNPMNSAQTVSFSASTQIDRTDFGLTWNAAVEGGKVMVSNKVTIELEVEASNQAPQAA